MPALRWLLNGFNPLVRKGVNKLFESEGTTELPSYVVYILTQLANSLMPSHSTQ